MMEQEVEQAIDRMHAPIGKLVVAFEHLVDALRQTSVHCFEKHGLAKPSLAELALSGLTAGPLIAAFESLIRESTSLTEPQEDLLSEIVRCARQVTQKRNIIIHGRWYWIDFATFPEGLPDGLVKTSRRIKSGLKVDLNMFKAEELASILEDVNNVHNLVRQLQN